MKRKINKIIKKKYHSSLMKNFWRFMYFYFCIFFYQEFFFNYFLPEYIISILSYLFRIKKFIFDQFFLIFKLTLFLVKSKSSFELSIKAQFDSSTVSKSQVYVTTTKEIQLTTLMNLAKNVKLCYYFVHISNSSW